MPVVKFSREPLMLTGEQLVWVNMIEGIAVDPVRQHRRVAELEAMVDTFVAAHGWAAATWKREPCIAPLFTDAEKRHP